MEIMKFENLTLFPYDLNLIDRSMLTDVEVAEINEYHAMVRERLSKHLTAEECAWLEEKTKELK